LAENSIFSARDICRLTGNEAFNLSIGRVAVIVAMISLVQGVKRLFAFMLSPVRQLGSRERKVKEIIKQKKVIIGIAVALLAVVLIATMVIACQPSAETVENTDTTRSKETTKTATSTKRDSSKSGSDKKDGKKDSESTDDKKSDKSEANTSASGNGNNNSTSTNANNNTTNGNASGGSGGNTGGGSGGSGGGTPPPVPPVDPNAGKTWHEAVMEWQIITPATTRTETYTEYVNMCYCGHILTGPFSQHSGQFPFGTGHDGFWSDKPVQRTRTVEVPAVWGWVEIRPAGWY